MTTENKNAEQSYLNDLPFGNDDGYDLNKATNTYAFPGRMWAFVANQEQEIPTPGMTKREYFAAMAMQSFIISKGVTTFEAATNKEDCMGDVAAASLSAADALLKQLNNG